MNKVNVLQLSRRHSSMLEFQDEIKPFTPTIRELKILWCLESECGVHLALTRMLERGWVIVKDNPESKYKRYYAVDADYSVKAKQ